MAPSFFTAKESLKWNPVNAEATFEYLDLIKRLGREDEYFKETIEAFLFIFRPEHIAKCYRNLGYYFMKNGKLQEAANCYLLSLRYDDADEKEMRSVYPEEPYKVMKRGRATRSKERYIRSSLRCLGSGGIICCRNRKILACFQMVSKPAVVQE